MKPQEICAYTFSFSETVNLKAQIESAKTILRIHSIITDLQEIGYAIFEEVDVRAVQPLHSRRVHLVLTIVDKKMI